MRESARTLHSPMSFKILFFAVLLTGGESAAVQLNSADMESPMPYWSAVHFRELPEGGNRYSHIQPGAVHSHEAPIDSGHPHGRLRRDLTATVNGGSNGNMNYDLRVDTPLAENDEHSLSIGVSSGFSTAGNGITTGGGLNYEHVNGHGASLSAMNVPGIGDQVKAAGRLNLLNIDDHRVDANAFHSRTYLEKFARTLNTNGGSLDYLYNDRHGVSLGMSHTDLLDLMTYHGTGKLNLYKSPSKDTSFDLTAGLSKSSSPYMEPTGWKPTYGFSFSRSW